MSSWFDAKLRLFCSQVRRTGQRPWVALPFFGIDVFF